jgi:hypothetical protein
MIETYIKEVCEELKQQGIANHESLCQRFRTWMAQRDSLPQHSDIESLDLEESELDELLKAGVAPLRWTLDHWARCP